MKEIPEIGVREARATFGPLIARAQHGGKSAIITRNGHRAAVLVPYEEWLACHPGESCLSETGASLPSENGAG